SAPQALLFNDVQFTAMSPMLRDRGNVVSRSERRWLETPSEERPQFLLTPTARAVLGTGYSPTGLRRSDNRTETYKDRRSPASTGKAPKGRRGNCWLLGRTFRFRRPPSPTRGGGA